MPDSPLNQSFSSHLWGSISYLRHPEIPLGQFLSNLDCRPNRKPLEHVAVGLSYSIRQTLRNQFRLTSWTGGSLKQTFKITDLSHYCSPSIADFYSVWVEKNCIPFCVLRCLDSRSSKSRHWFRSWLVYARTWHQLLFRWSHTNLSISAISFDQKRHALPSMPACEISQASAKLETLFDSHTCVAASGVSGFANWWNIIALTSAPERTTASLLISINGRTSFTFTSTNSSPSNQAILPRYPDMASLTRVFECLPWSSTPLMLQGSP